MVGPLRWYVKPAPLRRRFHLINVATDRLEQVPRRMRDLLDGRVEGLFVLLRRLAIAADLAHELESGGAHFVLSSFLVWSAEGHDAAAHGVSLSAGGRGRTQVGARR